MSTRVTIVALALSAVAGMASAGIQNMGVQALDIQNLTLPGDNVWNGSYGSRDTAGPSKDYGYLMQDAGDAANSLWVHETWTAAHQPSAILGVNIFNQGRSNPVITINKSVDNFTANNWTGFDITLSTLSGNIDLIGTPTATLFTHAQTFNNKSGMVVMSFDTGIVHPGDTVDFNFTFSVPYSGLWSFTITQTPQVPTPGTMALPALAGLMAVRRRRHS